MEIKRKIYSKILKRKRTCNGTEALLIECARRIGKSTATEVKSSKNYTTTSLGRFKEMFGKKIATPYIIHPKNFAIEGDVVKIPPYMFDVAFK